MRYRTGGLISWCESLDTRSVGQFAQLCPNTMAKMGMPRFGLSWRDLFGKPLKLLEDRRLINRAFLIACRKLGLASDGFDRPVQAFQVHAGVSRSQLHHLARVFIAQERSIGLPDQDDIVLLNRWEDDALHFLDAGIHVLQRPILMDHSAWMASVYVDWRRDQNALQEKSSYLNCFCEQLQRVFDGTGGAAIRVAPVPRLVWEDGRHKVVDPGAIATI